MPDPKEIAGVPLPVGDMAAGTVTVRVIKGSLSNNLPGQTVELLVNGVARRATTGESGRAEFAGLSVGDGVKAIAIVAGERLESQEFAVPSAGGTAVLLVATDPELPESRGRGSSTGVRSCSAWHRRPRRAVAFRRGARRGGAQRVQYSADREHGACSSRTT